MRRYGPAACALAASVTVLVAALIGPVGPAAAGSPAPQITPSCPTLAEWNSETHDGSHPGPVPNVMGMTRDNATAALARSGFGTTASPSEAAGDWTVSDQTPTGEEQADCGSTVAVDLEAPPVEVTDVEVPNVVDEPLDQAEQEIRDQGLVASVAEGDAADPRVVASQDPAAGTRVPSGSTVTLSLRPPTPESPAPERIEVPDLSGLSASAARDRLRTLGLTLVVRGDSGTVDEQDPAAGTLVERRSSVTVTLTPVTEPTDPASPDVTPGETDESPGISDIDPVATGSSSSPLPITLVAALAAAAVLIWALRRARRGRRTTWTPATPSVVCVPHADLSPYVELRELAPSLSLELVCHHDRGRQEIREIVR